MNAISKYILEPIDIGNQVLPDEAFAWNVRLATGNETSSMDLACRFDIPNGIYRIQPLNIRIQVVRHQENYYEFFTLLN